MTEAKGRVDNKRKEVVKSIAKDTAKFIARKAIEKSPRVEDSIEVMHDVVRHLMKKLGAERRRS